MGSDQADAVRLGRELEEFSRSAVDTHGLSLGASHGGGRTLARYRDFGVVVSDGQLCVHVGGRVGPPPAPGVLLARLDSERLLIEFAAAFLQLHRDEAHAGEGSHHFVRRVGLDYVQERIVKDPRGRSALFRVFQGTTGCPCPLARPGTKVSTIRRI